MNKLFSHVPFPIHKKVLTKCTKKENTIEHWIDRKWTYNEFLGEFQLWKNTYYRPIKYEGKIIAKFKFKHIK